MNELVLERGMKDPVRCPRSRVSFDELRVFLKVEAIVGVPPVPQTEQFVSCPVEMGDFLPLVCARVPSARAANCDDIATTDVYLVALDICS